MKRILKPGSFILIQKETCEHRAIQTTKKTECLKDFYSNFCTMSFSVLIFIEQECHPAH